MADNEALGVEKQEQAADAAVFGDGRTIGGANTVLLEHSDDNKLTAGSRQSELRLAWLQLHAALVAHDNILDVEGCGINDHIKHFRIVIDMSIPDKPREVREYFTVDYWSWMIKITDHAVITHQLTLWGYSRLQYLNDRPAVNSISGGQGGPSEDRGLLGLVQGKQ